MGEERRTDPRVPHAVPVRLKYQGVDDFLAAYTENISLGGVFVCTSVEVPVGTPVELTLEVLENKGFKVLAVVAWHRPATDAAPAGVGLRFTEVDDKHRRWLQQAVDVKLAEAAAGAPVAAEAAGEDTAEQEAELEEAEIVGEPPLPAETGAEADAD